MKLQIAFLVFGLVTVLGADVEPKIYQNLEEAETTNVLVTFKKAESSAALARFESLRLVGREAKLNTMHSILKDHADSVQSDVVSILERTRSVKKHTVSQLWISAELIVRNVDKETVEILSHHPDVASLVAEQFFPVLETWEEPYNATEDIGIQNQWGVVTVRAEAVWNLGWNGQGIVVGVTDTGARHTHVALQPRYRGTTQGSHNYNWFAPTGTAATPSDTNGHGTHCIGSIVGSANGIGVAPGAQWIACRGCATSSCSNFDLTQCGNWMACPTNTAGGAAQCAQAPRIVSNSWGGGRSNTFYDAIITAWRAAGIVPIFSAGNSGPACNSVLSPSDRPGAISIGSTTNTGIISSFSSRGTAGNGARKPEVSAPGSSVVSAGHEADTQYRTLSGTSMAGPHAAGVAALVLSRRPNLTVAQVQSILEAGTATITSGGQTCGGTADTVIPNNTGGFGRTDAVFANNS